MGLFYFNLIISIILFFVSVIYYAVTKQKFSLVVTLFDIFIIAGTYFSKYEQFSWTHEIYKFSTVEIKVSDYVEGDYYGEWKIGEDGDGYPQGKGRLTYTHFIDRKFYSLKDSEGVHKAIYYEGEFDYGRRMGHGIVVYEGGYYDEGEFFGDWEPGKVVFVGKRYKENEDGTKKYTNVTITAINGITGRDDYNPEYWLNVE